MLQTQEALIGLLLDELAKSGSNIGELRKLYERGLHTDALKESLTKLYQARKYNRVARELK